MDFNKDILEKITKKGALKAYDTKGIKTTFKSKRDGHEFGGTFNGMGEKASGDGTYKG